MKTIIRFLIVSSLVLTQISIAQWVQTHGPYHGDVFCFAVSGTNLFAGTYGGGVFLSTNNGTSWSAASSGLTNTDVRAFTVSGTNLFAGTLGGVFLSTNSGTSWSAASTGLTSKLVSALAISPAPGGAGQRLDSSSGTNLFAGTYGDGVILSTNNGTSWSAASTGLTNTSVLALAVSGTNLFAGTEWGGVFLSTNNGTSWSAASTGLMNTYVRALAVSPASGGAGSTNLFAGTSGGVFLSTNNGTSWTAASTGLTDIDVSALVVSGTNLFAGVASTLRSSSIVFLSTNNGTSWTAASTGLTNPSVNTFAVSGTNLFAGTADGVWRRPLSEMTGVDEQHSEVPTQFALQQNYPNPFNPTTTISYQLPVSSYVTLKVYDLLGREVATLVNEKKKAGNYSLQWDASGLSSGIYFYRLEANEKREIKKMVLMK
jgi:hypothetical protein